MWCHGPVPFYGSSNGLLMYLHLEFLYVFSLLTSFVWIIEETRGRDHVCREGGIDLKGRHLSRSVVQHWPASSQATLNTGQYHVLGFCSGLTAYLLYALVVEATKGTFSITYRERERGHGEPPHLGYCQQEEWQWLKHLLLCPFPLVSLTIWEEPLPLPHEVHLVGLFDWVH